MNQYDQDIVQEMALNARTVLPSAGGRIDAAVGLLTSYQVRPIDDHNAKVKDHHVTYRVSPGSWVACTCEDHHSHKTMGQMCCHGIAYLFWRKYTAKSTSTLPRLDALAQSLLRDDTENVTLVMDVFYAKKGPNYFRVVGWRGENVDPVYLEKPQDRIDVTSNQLYTLLSNVGYRMTNNRKGGGLTHHFTLIPLPKDVSVSKQSSVGVMHRQASNVNEFSNWRFNELHNHSSYNH